MGGRGWKEEEEEERGVEGYLREARGVVSADRHGGRIEQSPPPREEARAAGPQEPGGLSRFFRFFFF